MNHTIILATVTVFDGLSHLAYSLRQSDGTYTHEHMAEPGPQAWSYLTSTLPDAYITGPWSLRIHVSDRRKGN